MNYFQFLFVGFFNSELDLIFFRFVDLWSSFINLTFREEWTQSETRLNALDEGEFEPVVAKNGGAPLLANLRSAHARYGEVLGITSPVASEEGPEVREHFLKVIAAIKDYVVKAVAHADPEVPGSEALSESLIRPVVNWRDAPQKPRREEEEETPAAAPVNL